MIQLTNLQETRDLMNQLTVARKLLVKKYETDVSALLPIEAGDTVKQDKALNFQWVFYADYQLIEKRLNFLGVVEGYYLTEWARAGAGDQNALVSQYGITATVYQGPKPNISPVPLVGDLVDVEPFRFLAAKTVDGKVIDDETPAGKVIDYTYNGLALKLVKVERRNPFAENRKVEWWQAV